MRGKFSFISGRMPNLLPGQWGVNLADAILFLRAAGKMLSVKINDIALQSAPPKGAIGAPLRQGAAGFEIAEDLLPLGVVNGRIHVDQPPTVFQNKVPGVVILSAGDPFPIPAETLLVEPFYVASQDFILTRIAYSLTTPDPVVLKFGIADSSGAILIEDNVASASAGLNGSDITLPLAPGLYHAFLWVSQPTTLRTLKAARPNQPFTLDGLGEPVFKRRLFGPSGAYEFTALPAITPTSAATSAEPGEDRCLVFQWSIAP